MGKIKLNLVSGAIVEKPLINAFKANNNSYIILDNELNGSMGLPIILVCKFENDKLIKINDQNEWGIVKEYLKNIIAGNKIENIKVANELQADDIYYTQLTLPVPSFDALKKAYNIENVVESTAAVNEQIQKFDAPEMNPIMQNIVTPVAEEAVVPQNDTPVVNDVPIIDIPVNPVIDNSINPIVENPVNTEGINSTVNVTETNNFATSVSPLDNVNQISSVVEASPSPVVELVIPPTPEIVNEVTNIPQEEIKNDENIFSEQKEAFMQACENMFDALIQKFERELENRR